MRFRWTMKELTEFSPSRIVAGILTERISDLNGYCPLARKLSELRTALEREADGIDLLLNKEV